MVVAEVGTRGTATYTELDLIGCASYSAACPSDSTATFGATLTVSQVGAALVAGSATFTALAERTDLNAVPR